MPYLTLTEKVTAITSPSLVDPYDIQPRNEVGLFGDTKHQNTYLLTYFPEYPRAYSR